MIIEGKQILASEGEKWVMVVTKKWNCNLLIDAVSGKIVFAGASLSRFKGSTVSRLKDWMAKCQISYHTEDIRDA